QLGSVVGGDGAMYAVRNGSYRPMLASALSDFVNPLQVVESGERCVYESEAACSEAAGGTFGNEFSRKIRIVNRAWRAMMSMKQMLNPFRFGFFSFQLISHKLLRWLVPVFLTSALVLNLLLLNESPVYQLTITVQL